MFPGGTSDQNSATYERLDYLFKARKSGPVGIDRVAWIGGDLNGYGLVVRDAVQRQLEKTLATIRIDHRRQLKLTTDDN